MKITNYNLCAILIILFILNSISRGQDSSLVQKIPSYLIDELTVTATRFGTGLNDLPTKVTIINREQISSVNGIRLPDVLKTGPGIFIKSYGPAPALSSISMNGMGAEHTLILIDGVRLNFFQNSHIDLSLIPLDNIERIEIVNNGLSSVYGSDAIGGVVNLITVKRINPKSERDFELMASFTNGSDNTSGYSLALYQEFRNFNARISYRREKSDGDYEYLYDNGIGTVKKNRENAAYLTNDLGVNSQYLLNEKNLIRFNSFYTEQDKNIPGIETGTIPPPAGQSDKNWNNILILENIFSEELTLKSGLNFQNNHMRYSVEPVLNSFYRNLVYSAFSEVFLGRSLYGVTAGYDYTHALLKSNEIIEGTKRNQHAFYFSSVINLSGKLKLFPSARFDYISDLNEGALTYKIGINYLPLSADYIRIRGNAGRNFRAPSFNDLYWKSSGNSKLNPEYSFNAEAGIRLNFPGFYKLLFDITYTHISATDKIVWIPGANNLWTPQNVAASVSNNYSFTASMSESVYGVLKIGLNLGFQFVRSKKTSRSFTGDPSENKYFPFIPTESSNINIRAEYKSLELNLFYAHLGRRYSDFANTLRLASVNTLDGNLALNTGIFGISGRIKFELNNILDNNYQILSGYPMPLRNYRVTLTLAY